MRVDSGATVSHGEVLTFVSELKSHLGGEALSLRLIAGLTGSSLANSAVSSGNMDVSANLLV